jgi:radical SAM superfamily enzyme YgiQ (UPF0313 family)
MRILLYNPDNGVTRNFMPHLWMFLLQALTPAGHEVVLIDGNAQPMDEEAIAKFVIAEKIGLVGIGAMTRMIAKAYRMADAIRAVGVPVVMGGPHVTEMADEALGRAGGPRHADAVALGEADETWPRIVNDAAKGALKDVYAPVDAFGQEHKHHRPETIQYRSKVFQIHAAKNWRRLGNIPHHPGRVRARLPLRLRVLHRDRLFRRLHSLSHQRKRGE